MIIDAVLNYSVLSANFPDDSCLNRCWLSVRISTAPTEVPQRTHDRRLPQQHHDSAGHCLRLWRAYDIQSGLDPRDDRLGHPRLLAQASSSGFVKLLAHEFLFSRELREVSNAKLLHVLSCAVDSLPSSASGLEAFWDGINRPK
jgi:hypothetical protein